MTEGEQIEKGVEEILFETLSLSTKEMKYLQCSLVACVLGLWPILCTPRTSAHHLGDFPTVCPIHSLNDAT